VAGYGTLGYGAPAALIPGQGTGLPTTPSPYGSGPGAAMEVVSALAVATSSVLVTLSAQPLAASPTGVGDATNPFTWQVNALNPDGSVGASFPVVSAETTANPLSIQVNVFGAFPPWTNSPNLQIAAPGLLALDGSLVGANIAQFSGCQAVAQSTPEQVAAAQQLAPADIANPPYQGPTGGGTLVMGSDGDYATETGIALTKKLIVRRLMTSPGAFYHLPDYGAGLGVKQPLPLGEAVKLQKRVKQQALKVRGVTSADVSVVVRSGQVVSVSINTKAQNGQGFSIGLAVGGRANV
jgi:hypothetical protein